jgi:tetratricopeptide (TPR) repeat protein
MIRFFISLILTLSCSQALAKEYVSSDQIIKQIEKSLIFDNETRQKLDVYGKKNGSKRSDEVIEAGNLDSAPENSGVDIVVVDSKVGNLPLREKEKLAYNSALVGQYEVAIELYKQVLAKEPKNAYAKFSLAVVYQKIGQLKQAKNLYYELLKLSPDNREEIVGNLLAVLVEESPKESTYVLSRLAAQNPNSGKILAQAALAYDKIEKYDQAVELLKSAVNLEPERLDYKYNLAVIYDKMQDYQNASTFYSEVIANYSVKYSSVPLSAVKERLEFIKSANL